MSFPPKPPPVFFPPLPSPFRQDAALRSAADKHLEDQQLEKAARELLQQQERARQWRIARGEGTAEDLRGPVGPAARDTWMTDLPVARSGGGQPSQTSVRSFSIKGVRERGDTSGWTSVAGKQGPLQLQAAVCGVVGQQYVMLWGICCTCIGNMVVVFAFCFCPFVCGCR